MKRFTILLFALSSVFSTVTYASGKPIRIGVDATFPPFESINADGKVEGFEIDLGNAICAKIHRQCQWVPSAFDGIIVSLSAHKLDAVMSSLGITKKRERRVLFTDVVWSGYSSMLSRKNANLKPTLASLKGHTIGVQMGSMQEDFVRERFGDHGVTIKTYQDQDQVYSDLMSGRIDASFQDMIQAQFNFINAGKHTDFSNQKVEDKLLPAKTAIAVRKHDKKLAELFNQGLKAIHQDGTYDKIQRQYFGDLKLYSDK